MTTKQTPTPWTQCADSYDRLAIQGSDGSFIADMIHEYSAPSSENAAFIVRACNAHDELVAALELAQATIERITVNHGPFSSTSGTLDVIRAALEKVSK